MENIVGSKSRSDDAKGKYIPNPSQNQSLNKSENIKTKSASHPVAAMDKAFLIDMYRLMYTSRKVDDAEISLKKQNKAYFQISGAGHEAINVAVAKTMKSGYDWFYTYYRDRALCLALGVTPYEMLLQAVGAADDPASGGRQMPAHYGHKDYNIVTNSSPTGSQYLNAVGTAEAGRFLKSTPQMGQFPAYSDEITFVSSGEGATSQGDFWESLNTACVSKLPVLFLVEDNGYAISVPVEAQTPGGNVVRLLENFPNLRTFYVDGNDLAVSYNCLQEVVAYLRTGQGPAAVHAKVTRPYSHSLSDDHIFYRTKIELEEEAKNDCLKVNEELFLKHGVCTKEELEALKREVVASVREASDKALEAAKPAKETAMDFLYSHTVDPTSSEFDTDPVFDGPDNVPMGQLINRCIVDEMNKNPAIVVFGEDVADVTREENLGECKGKGGVFKLTQGLQTKFTGKRVFNSPLAESNIIGRAVGMATRGMKPCVEIQFFDYIWTAMNQLRNEMATLRYRSHDKFSCPMVVRVPIGGYIGGGSIYHSQTGENLFIHTPGIRVVYPSNALDANGLLRTALRCDDPVLFLEHKTLYYQGYNRCAYPGDNYMVPFGKARIAREGKDLTIVCWGHLVYRSLEVAKTLAKEGYEVEVIDLRTLSPVDMDTVFASVKKTNRVIVAHEEHVFGGFGGEIAAQIADVTFQHLDAPVKRVGSKHCWVAYSPILEDVLLPQTDDVLQAARATLKF